MELLQKALALAPKIRAISDAVLARHIQRGDVVKATWLSLVSGRPAFFLGDPGIDKTGTVQELARRIARAVFYDALMPTIISVEQLLVESTSIEEVPTAGGGKAIRTRDTLGRAALAHILFADEIWKADPRVLQTTLDLAKGDGVRSEGQMVRTPLLSFLAASNELPDSEENLGAIWSRMTIRVEVYPLDRAGKEKLVKARLNRDRSGRKDAGAEQISIEEVEMLRQARPHVEVSEEIVGIVLDLLQDLATADTTKADFEWAWNDDRRFGRIFDVLQAHALLDGRDAVSKRDLVVLEWLLWDRPEHIATVKVKIAPFARTPLSEAQEMVDALLSPSGAVELAITTGDLQKGTPALKQCKDTLEELSRLRGESEASDQPRIDAMIGQVRAIRDLAIGVISGTVEQAEGSARFAKLKGGS